MDEEGEVTAQTLVITNKPLESEPQKQPGTSFEASNSRDQSITKSHSLTLGHEKQAKPPPTAKVAPLVGSVSSTSRNVSPGTSPSRNPLKNSRHGLERRNYGVDSALSSPSLDRFHEKADIRDVVALSSSKSEKQIMSLKKSLSERSQLIERQQLMIARLQQECRDKETQLRNLRLHGNLEGLVHSDTSDPLSTSSSPSVTTAISAPVKIDMLSRKLDSLYYELDQNKKELESTTTKLKQQETRSSDLDKQLVESRQRVKELEQKIDKLQGYLGNTPTMEEHYGLKETVSSLTTRCDQLTKQVQTSTEQLVSSNETVKMKEKEIHERLAEILDIGGKNQELETRVHTLEGKLSAVQIVNEHLKEENHKLQEDAGMFEQRLRNELNAMRERHHGRFRDATAKLREQHKEVVKRNKLLEKQLVKSSDTMTELNTELNLRQGMVGELKSSVNALVCENQGLLQQNLVLQATNAEVIRSRQSSPSDGGTVQKQLQEMSLCVEDFESLISLVSSMIEGQDPSSSILLGVKSGIVEGASPLHFANDEASLQKQLERTQKLRGEIERLRGVVTERYADQVANDCTVQ